MAAQATKGELIGLVEGMARDEDGTVANRLKAIEFLLEHGEEGAGDVREVWDELFLVGELKGE